jgi:phosphohistidine phosphatase
MRLYVMRHGPAEDRAPTGTDFDRRLTSSGRELVARVARAFHSARAGGVVSTATPLRILSSPRVRARETATIVRDALVSIPHAIEIEIHEGLGGETPIPHALIAAAAAAGVDTLLVGHQPVVEELVQQLVGGRPVRTGFSTATVVGLDHAPDGAGWTLATHLDPSRLPG